MTSTVVVLTLVYALTLASFHPWDLAIGAGVSTLFVFFTRRFVFHNDPAATNFFARFVWFWPFAAATVWDIVRGTWEVTLVTLGIRPLVSPGIVRIPIGDRTPTGVAVSGMATTLSPGTFLVDVDWEEGVWLVHAIDAADPDGVRREHQEFYERWQRKVFP